MKIFGWELGKKPTNNKTKGETLLLENNVDLSLIPLDNLVEEIVKRSKTIAIGYIPLGEEDARTHYKTDNVPDGLWVTSILKIKAEEDLLDE